MNEQIKTSPETEFVTIVTKNRTEFRKKVPTKKRTRGVYESLKTGETMIVKHLTFWCPGTSVRPIEHNNQRMFEITKTRPSPWELTDPDYRQRALNLGD